MSAEAAPRAQLPPTWRMLWALMRFAGRPHRRVHEITTVLR
jgi:hypothetical protein